MADLSNNIDLDREEFLKRAKAVLSFLFTRHVKQLVTKYPLEDAEEIGTVMGAFSLWMEVGRKFVSAVWMRKRCCLIFFNRGHDPKLILDKEPKIVFMYKLVGANIMRGDEIVDQFRRNYKEPNKIFVLKILKNLKRF